MSVPAYDQAGKYLFAIDERRVGEFTANPSQTIWGRCIAKCPTPDRCRPSCTLSDPEELVLGELRGGKLIYIADPICSLRDCEREKFQDC